MIRIAMCDDDISELNRARVLLDQYREERQREIAYTSFQSALDLLAEVERGTRFDILFLDVLMPGQNGMEAAKELRQMDENVKIIFLTSSPEFAVESYTVNAYFYQLKPIWKESFFHIMDAVLETCAVEQVQGTPADRILRGDSPHATAPPDLWPDAGDQRHIGGSQCPTAALWGVSAAPPVLFGEYGLCAENLLPGHHHAVSDRNSHSPGKV